jgi:Trk-type K+ transport system membrane component
MLQRSVHDDEAFAGLIQWVPAALLTLVVAGAWLLIGLPGFRAPGTRLTGSEALFTMTSAVCGVGLSVVKIGTGFTPAGQALIALAMELGTLIYMIAGAAVALRIKARLLGEKPGEGPTWGRLILGVAGLALALQLLAAVLLGALAGPPADRWSGDGGPLARAGWALFHAAAAFANCSFTLQNNSLCEYQYCLAVHAVLAPLIVLGGLGYVVLVDLRRWLRRGARPGAFTRLALAATAGAYLLGVVGLGAARLMPYAFAALNLGHETTRPLLLPMNTRTVGSVLADASFMSISGRGAGFRIRAADTPYVAPELLPPLNATPESAAAVMARLVPAKAHWQRVDRDTVYINDQLYKAQSAGPGHDLPGEDVTYMLLMSIGGTPGGSAGGFTTLVAAILVLAVIATAWGRCPVRSAGVSLGEPCLRMALTLLAAFIALVALATLLLALVEPFPTWQLAFEAVSAAGGGGLSKGLCPDMTTFGRGVIMAAMFLGRVGLLMLMAAVVMGPRPSAPEPASPYDARG